MAFSIILMTSKANFMLTTIQNLREEVSASSIAGTLILPSAFSFLLLL
jgi:hypothetical protein